MWGSGWPALTATANDLHWLEMSKAMVGRLAAGHEGDVFASNARRFYRQERRAYL